MTTTDWLEDVVLDLTEVDALADLDPGALAWDPGRGDDPR
jgi:hypothetical protein